MISFLRLTLQLCAIGFIL